MTSSTSSAEKFVPASVLEKGTQYVEDWSEQYLLGMLEYVQQHFEAARGEFDLALSIYPSHERSLLALGKLELRQGDPAAAAQSLEKAYQVNGARTSCLPRPRTGGKLTTLGRRENHVRKSQHHAAGGYR